jgi:hypothetical protein
MVIERSGNNKLVITLPDNMDGVAIQRIIDFFQYLDITAKSKATQADADQLAEEANAAWFQARASRLKK